MQESENKSDSTTQSAGYTSTDNESDSSSCSSGNEEVWNGILPEILTRDLNNQPPAFPNVVPHQRSLHKVSSLVFWFVYFLLFWQVTCHISDNLMAWHLRFIVSWLKVLGVEVPSEVLPQLVTLSRFSLHYEACFKPRKG